LDQPNFSAPSSRHSSKWREEKGRQALRDFRFVDDASRTGSILSSSASSSIADSIAYRPARRLVTHVGACANVALCPSERYAQVSSCIENGVVSPASLRGEHHLIAGRHICWSDEVAIGIAQADRCCVRGDDRRLNSFAAEHVSWWPNWRAAAAASAQCVQEKACLENPTRHLEMTRPLFGKPNICARWSKVNDSLR